MLSNFSSNHVAIRDLFDERDLLEQITETLQTLGVATNVIDVDDLESSPSRFEVVLDLNDGQKQQLGNITSGDLSAKEKYIQCVSYLMS